MYTCKRSRYTTCPVAHNMQSVGHIASSPLVLITILLQWIQAEIIGGPLLAGSRSVLEFVVPG